MTPADAMMSQVQWEPIPGAGPGSDDLPYATHSGTLTFAGLTLRCYQLADGRRIIDVDDCADLFGLPADAAR